MIKPLNLQLFADAAPAEGTPEATTPPTFDELLKDKNNQSEFDRRVSKALETAKSKWAEEEAVKLEAVKTEAEKLAKMNAEQKAEHERLKRDKELADREALLTLRELRAEAAGTLAEKGLPKELIDSVNFKDADSCKKSIESLETVWRAAVQSGVEERLKGKTPTVAGETKVAGDPKTMNYQQRAELYSKDPAAYRKLFGGE